MNEQISNLNKQVEIISNTNETIAAQATAMGRAGVGIIRISGALASKVAVELLGKVPKIRYAEYLPFYNNDHSVLDHGIAIFFKKPYSFTGEDVLELQGHGGQVILDLLLKRILSLKGIRLAKPGEFSERAFLNNKLDLTQAEAIADLINADSEQAALSAIRSLQGEFSTQINYLIDEITNLRTYIEASIDFSDEDIDFLAEGGVQQKLADIIDRVEKVQSSAKQGSILKEGMKIVIAGKPNAGKSSLLNLLAEKDVAIVSDIAGTTRDVIQEQINIDGMPLHIIDTAGLRESTDDEIEKIGINRAFKEIKQADLLLFVVDSTDHEINEIKELYAQLLENLSDIPVLIVYNKIDLIKDKPTVNKIDNFDLIYLSTKTKTGLVELKEYLKKKMGYKNNVEGVFLARRRHLTSLNQAKSHLNSTLNLLIEQYPLELLAEELRLAQQDLSEITGKFTADDLLSSIFSTFCIGK